MSDDFDAAKKRLEEMDRANLFLNHGRAKHADACWRCDEPWPCLTMRVVIDADHEWAQWRDKWIAALDLMGSQSERAEKAEAWLAMATDEMKAEREGTLDLRRRFGARDDETFPEFVERLATERERMKAEAEASEHESRANRWMVRAQHAEAELAVERVRRRRNREEAIGNAKAYYAERERAKRLEQALAGWLATESLPDCRACAVLDAGLPELALRPAAPEAKESDCTCGEQWPCPLHGGPPAAPEPTPSEEKP